MNNAFYFLAQDMSTNSYVVRKGQVFFADFYQEGEDEYYSFPTTMEASSQRLLITSQHQFYLGIDGGLSAGLNRFYRLYHQLENKPGEISFNYVNEDIEGITAFSFEVDPLWLESEDAVNFGFMVKDKIFGTTEASDPIIYQKTKTSLQQLVADTEGSFYTIHHRYDPLVEREVIHVEFKHIQGKNRYIAFEFQLRPVGNSSPKVYNLKVLKKTLARICAAEGDELELPIHGFVHDRTVTEVNINQSRIALERDGSFRYKYKLDPQRKQIPVEISCVNSTGETASLSFIVEVVTSENGLGKIEYKQEDGTYLPLPKDILTTTEEMLILTGEYYGLDGAVAGYELYGYEYQDGVETVNLVKRGLFTTTEDSSVYERFGLSPYTIGSGFVAGYFQDQGIRLIAGRQQLRVYTENPGGHRQVFQTDLNYSMPPSEQRITFDLEKLNPVEVEQDVPIEYQLQLVAYEREGDNSTGEPAYVFARDYELIGEIKSLYTIPDVLVKSFTPGLTFTDGATEETVQVEAGNRFRIKVRLEMDAVCNTQDFYIGVIPKIPALLSLRTGIRITAGKDFQDTNFIPDFDRLHPDNWTEQEQSSRRIPIRVKFNRGDLPSLGSWLTLTVNHETVISGYLDPNDDGYYWLKDEHTQESLELSGLKYGRNRIEWILHYRDTQNGNRYTVSSSNSGRTDMHPYLFDYLETIQGSTTEIWFSPSLTNQYYNADTLPDLNINKAKNTEVKISLNGSLLAEDLGEQETMTGLTLAEANEGRNELTVVCFEPMREPMTKTFNFLYDSLAPEVAIASWRLAEDGQSLTELTATVTEASFAEAYLCFGADVVSQYPEVTIAGTDQYFLRWTNLSAYQIKPAVKPVTVRVHDHSGKIGSSESLVLTGNPRPEEESAREIKIPLPIYGSLPSLAHESIYHIRPSAAHTKFAPRHFSPQESALGEIGRDGDYLTRNLFAQKVSPGAEIESFGSSVAVFGDYALVGAPGEDGDRGAAYLFEMDEDGVWQQKQRLIASDGVSGDLFGFSVALAEEHAVVGAYGKKSNTGAVYIFQKEAAGVWTEKVKLSGVSNDHFGYAVAVAEQTIAIGAPSIGTNKQKGKIYIFEKNGEATWNWSQPQILQLIYDANDFNVDFTPSSIYFRLFGGGVQTTKSIAENGDYFGCSLSISENKMIAGSTSAYVVIRVTKKSTLFSFSETRSFAFSLPGEALIFERNDNGHWSVQSKLPHSGVGRDQYGHAVTLLNNRALVGAYGENNNMGAVYVYEPNEVGVWRERKRLMFGREKEHFGYAVSLFNNGALIGTYGPDTNNRAAYVYRIDDNGDWLEPDVLTNGRPLWEEKFGRSVAVCGDKALIGNSGSTMFYWLDSGNHNVPYNQTYLVFKVKKDRYGTFSKEELKNSIRFEALGYSQGVISEEITEVNPREIILGNTRWLEGFNHYYCLVELAELRGKFSTALGEYFPTRTTEDGYLIHDLGALRIRYDEPVTQDNLIDVYITGGEEDEIKDILLYEPNYEDPSQPGHLHPALLHDPAEVSFGETAAADERTINFWLRLEDEGIWEEDYIETIKKRVFSVFSAQGAPLFELGYMGEMMYLHDPMAGVAGEVGPLHTFFDNDKWNMVSLRVRKDQPGLELGINNQWALYEGLSPETQEQLMAEGVKFFFGPLPDEDKNTGFFSVAGPFYIDQYLTNSEIERVYKLSAQYMNTDRKYHFSDAASDVGAQQFQLRTVGDGDDYFTPRENHDPGEGRGYGSLKASSRLRNLLRKVAADEGRSYVIFAETGDGLPFNMEVRSGTDHFSLQPTGKTGRYYFGNENSNYGLGQDRWYSVSGRVTAIEPQTTARLVLRINGQEQSWPLSLGRFHFIYDNPELISPTQVQMYIESDGPVTLGHDLALNQGNYIVQEDLETSAVRTLFPFGLSGTVHFWYKPLNANADGFVNYDVVLFDSELIKVWTVLDEQGDATFIAGIKNSQGQITNTIRTNVKVNHKWQHLQLSYNFTEPGYDEMNVAYLYIDGALVGSLEGIRVIPFGSLIGETPETDNVWLGCDQREVTFAEGYLDDVVLNKYYQHEKYVPQQPAVLTYDQDAAEICLVMNENLPEPDSCRYFLTGISHFCQAEGDAFPVKLGNLPAGRYRLTADLVINGHHYQDIIFFNLDQQPNFVLLERTPLLFRGNAQDVHFKFAYDDSYRFATKELSYVGLAARITYQTNGTPQEEIRYLVQDFLTQDFSKWLRGNAEPEGMVWEPLPTDNVGLLDLVFPEIISDTGVSCEFKYFYFDRLFSTEQEFFSLPDSALEVWIPTAALNVVIEEDGDGNGYKVVVDMTNGQGGAVDPFMNTLSLEYETVHLETGARKNDRRDLFTHGSEHGRIELFYDDILHWNGEVPLYGEYSFILRLMQADEVYLETEAIKLVWTEREEQVASSVIQKLEITEFSLLHIDDRNPEKVTASYYLEFAKNGIGSISPQLEIINSEKALVSTKQLPNIPTDQTSRIFTGIEIPKGVFVARLTLTAEGFVRTQELTVNNIVDKPEVVLTNSVGSLIQYNNVLFSWKGYYEGQFHEGIQYQYNLDHKGWTSPNSQWRSVRFYNLAEGYHTFQVRAIYQDVPSEIRQVTFFVDTQKPEFDPEKITVQRIYDEQDVFYAVKLVGAPGAITDISLHEVCVEGESVAFQPDGSFISGLIPIKTDGVQKIQLTGYDRVNNYNDYTIEVENRLTEILFPSQQQRVQYSPFTLVGTVNNDLDAQLCIYVADTQTNNADEYSGWKQAIINPDRTFFVENLFLSPGTPEREVVTTLRMASVFASGKVFEREIKLSANEVILPLEMELSAHAAEGESSEVPVTISCQANIPNISSWSIDFDGDGVYDLVELNDNPASPEGQRRSWEYRYSALGVVNPRVRVITTDGDFFSTSKSLIIHERIREVSFKLAPNPISLTSVRMPDEANRLFVLREASGEFLVEVYEIRRNDHYLSQRLFTINLSAWQLKNPVKIKALNEVCLFVATNDQGKGEIYQLNTDQFGNYHLVAKVSLPDEIADFTVQPERLTVTMNRSNTVCQIPLTEGIVNQDGLINISPTLINTLPLGVKTGIDTDGHNFFLADYYNQRIIEFSPSLRLVDQFGARGNGEAEFIRPELIRYYENRILVSDSGRRDLQVFDRAYNPLCTLGYREGADYNYVEPEFFAEITDFEIIAREEGDRLYYYALVLSGSAGKLSMIRLPQWEELKARVRNNRIVFLKDGEIYTAKPDGGDLRKVLSSDSLPRIQGTLDYPALAPDGRRLAFTSRIRLYNGSPGYYDEDNIYTYSNLYCFDLENNNLVKVDLGALNGYELERPVFNSNGTKLVFSAKTKGGKWSIYIYDLLTSHVTRVFQTNENARFPYYSPDDRFIVFTSDFGGNEQIELINTENPSVRVRVTANDSRNSLPVWSRVYPGEITDDELQKKIQSKLAFVSEQNNYRGIYYVYLSHEGDDALSIYDLVKKRVAGDQPDTAALEITTSAVEGDYPCFTGDGRHLIFQYYDGVQDRLKKVDLENNFDALQKKEPLILTDLPLIQGAGRPAGMKNMITNFIADNHNGNEIALSWDRYTEHDVFYIVQYKPVNSDDLYQNYVLSQTGTVLSGLKMGTDYLVRVFIMENEVEVATSYWARVKMPEVVARPSYTIDPDNPYLVHLEAWKPQPEENYKWRFSWVVENNEIQVQNSQTYLYEFGTSGTKTVFLKAYTEGQTATHISDPLEVKVISDLHPVIQANLAEDSSYIELSAESSLGKKINLASAQWVISGPGREPVMATGSRVIVQLDGFQHRINVSLTLERIPVNNERDVVQVNKTIDMDIKEVKPVITYEPLPENNRLIRFSGEYSMGNINWPGVSWTLFADGGVIYAADGVTTFDYLFPETNQDTVYTVALTVPRRNDGKTATASQLVTVEATPIEPKINYEILELKQGEKVVGAKVLFDCTESLGSGIDYSLARWVVPAAATYGEQAVQVGPTAAYNLFGIGEDMVIEVALTLSRRNGTDPITITKLINISRNQLSQGRVVVRKKLEEGHFGKVLVLDVLSSTGPNIDWERTEWQIEGEQYVRRGPVVRMDLPAAAEDRTIGFTCLLYRYGAAEPEILHDSVELKKTAIKPIITADRLSGTQHRMYQLSVLETKGVNIDWERTRWFVYDGGDQAEELRGSVVGYEFPYKDGNMGYPVLVQMFLKGSSQPFIAYTTINVEEDLLIPIITTEVDPARPNVVTFSATGSLGSNINWNQVLWNFGDASTPQLGPVVTHEYPLSERAATYRVTLTLPRNLPGVSQEIKTATREIRMGPDLIRAVIKATKYGDYLILSAEDSEGKGLLLDRCTWLFEGQGDTESYGRNTQEGVQQRESYSETTGSGTRTSKTNSVSGSVSVGISFLKIIDFGSASASYSHSTTTETSSNESYTHVLDEGYNYTDGENYNFSTQNSHTGAVCRRYVGDSSYLVVTLFVYRMTETGMEGESVTVRVNLKDANLVRGAIYGR